MCVVDQKRESLVVQDEGGDPSLLFLGESPHLRGPIRAQDRQFDGSIVDDDICRLAAPEAQLAGRLHGKAVFGDNLHVMVARCAVPFEVPELASRQAELGCADYSLGCFLP